MHPLKPLILLVEDDEDSRGAFRNLLRMQGWRVCEAIDGREALAQTKHLKPAIVLLDVTLPYLSGIEVAKQLKTEVEIKDIPLIAMTGHTLEQQEKCLFASVVSKPIDFNYLLMIVEKLLKTVPATN